MKSSPLIAIDGPAGSGKSTLARGLARELDLAYVNTGVMYRALTARALAAGLDRDDSDQLVEAFAQMRFGLSAEPPRVLTIDGSVPGEELNTEAVEGAVSQVARHPKVRAAMREEQRRLGADGAVMEGRDIGSVVFPDADVKIFLLAGAGERAARRIAERGGSDVMADELVARDEKDEKVNPFVPQDDAIAIDTTPNTPAETLAQALDAIRTRLAGRCTDDAAPDR